ncbi:MAG: histidine kinase, partial [Bacteroidota bacterium]
STIVVPIQITPAFWQTWWFRLSLLLLGLGIVQWMIYRVQKRRLQEDRYKQRIEQLRSVALRSQMNPHFIFNTLNAILFFLVKNDRQASIKYLSKFSKLIRSIFDHAKHERVTLAQEIQFLENYLELEYLRFGNRVELQQHIDPHLRSSSILIPPLLIQPLLENAFKHGLFHKREKGILHFSIQEQAQSILVIVEDNGIGRKKSAFINQKRKRSKVHNSGTVIAERIALLNSKRPSHQPKIKLDIIDLLDQNQVARGTRNEMTIYY